MKSTTNKLLLAFDYMVPTIALLFEHCFLSAIPVLRRFYLSLMPVVIALVFIMKDGFYPVIEAELSLDGPLLGHASYPIVFFMLSGVLLIFADWFSFVKLDKLKKNEVMKAVYKVGSYKEAFAIDPKYGY